MAMPASRWDPRQTLWRIILSAAGSTGSPLPQTVSAVDLRLLLQVRSGDTLAQEAYVGRFWPEVERNAGYYAERGGSRDDLVAEGALALWEAAFNYDPHRHRTAPESFVRNQIHRRVRGAYRDALGYSSHSIETVPFPGDARFAREEDGFRHVEARLDIHRGLSRLPERDRVVLRDYLALVEDRGLSPEEASSRIAARRGRSKAAVKKQVQRVRRRLSAIVSGR